MGLPILGLALTAGASFVQARAQAQAAQAQMKFANDQLKFDMENERIRGLQEASNRQEEYLRNLGTNIVAASAATGGGSNFSFDQGIAPYNKEVARRDLAAIGFNNQMERGRMALQIKANTYSARANSRNAYIGAAADTVGAVGSAMVSNPEIFRSRPGGLLAKG